MPTRDIFNANTQTVEPAELTVDANNEIVATFADKTFLKFPAGLTQEDFGAQITAVQTANEGQEVITPEIQAEQEAQRANSFALIGETPPAPVEAEAPAPVEAPMEPEAETPPETVTPVEGNTMPTEQFNATDTSEPSAPVTVLN